MDEAWAWSILFGVASLLAGAGFAWFIQMKAEQSHARAQIALIASAMPLGVWLMAWSILAAPPDHWRRTFAVLIGGILGAVIAFGASELLHGPARAQPASLSDEGPSMPNKPIPPPMSPPASSSGNFSVNQQGGTVNQTYVNEVPPKLRFTEGLGLDLLSKIAKNKPLNITLTGSQSDLQVGEDFANFFRRHGYIVNYISTMMLMPPPEHQMTLTESPTSRDLVIAPSVR